MALKLRVISDHYKALGKRSSRLFGVTGGRIGRAQDNDWVLPDPDRYVSSHHCKVEFKAGQWILEDASTNGVFIGSRRVKHHRLIDGDVIVLGEHKLVYRDLRPRKGNVVSLGERSAHHEAKVGGADAD